MAEVYQPPKTDVEKLREILQIKPEDLAALDPNLQQLRRADLLVKTPVPDPLTSVIEAEAYDIAKISILRDIFTLTLPVYDVKDGKEVLIRKEVYGGLPAISAGLIQLKDILPAIDGKRANQFVDAIKPAQPNVPQEMPREEKEGVLDKVRSLLFGRGKSEQNRYQER